MPITFAQPEPYAPGISYAYGGSQALQQGLPALMAANQQVQQAYSHGQDQALSAYERQQALSEHALDRERNDPLRTYLGKTMIDRQMEEGDRQRFLQSLDQYQNQQQNQQQATAAPAQNPVDVANEAYLRDAPQQEPTGVVSGNAGDWRGTGAGDVADQRPTNLPPLSPMQRADQLPYNNADELDRQRISSAVSNIRSQLRSGVLDPRTAQMSLARLLDPLQQLERRRQDMQNQMQQETLQKMQRENQVQNQLDINNRTERAKANADGFRNLPGPDGTPIPHYWDDHTQRWRPSEGWIASLDRQAKQEATAATAATAAETRDAAARQTRQTAIDKEVDNAAKVWEAQFERRHRQVEQSLPPPVAADTGRPVDETPEARTARLDRIQQETRAHMLRHHGYATVEELRSAVRAQHEDLPFQQTPNSSRQRIQMAAFDQVEQRATQIPDSYVPQWIRQARATYQRYGTVHNMPANVRRSYEIILRDIDQGLRRAG